MNLKKLVATSLVASMVVSGMTLFNANESVQATTVANVAQQGITLPIAKTRIDVATLQKNAKAKNSQSDHPASHAFTDDVNQHWHSVQAGNDGKAENGNKVWIQTGFDKVLKLKELTYLNRDNNINNQILEYELWVSTQETEPNVATTASSNVDGWKLVSKETDAFADTVGEKKITLEQATDAKWVRLVAKSVHGGWDGNKYVIATKIQLFEEKTLNEKLYSMVSSAQNYSWTSETEAAAKSAINTALEACKNSATNEQNAIVTLSRALNNATRLYNVDVLVDGNKNADMSFKQVYNQAKPNTTISAPTTQSGKGNFVGWFKKKGAEYLYRVTDANTTNLDVVASNDVTYEAVYGTAPQHSSEAGIEMQNSFVSKVGQTYSAKFVGKYFNIPQDATNVKFGLKWGKDENQLTPVQFNSSANKYQQFSLTVNGLTEGQAVTGQVYVTYTLNGQQQEKVSEKVTLFI